MDFEPSFDDFLMQAEVRAVRDAVAASVVDMVAESPTTGGPCFWVAHDNDDGNGDSDGAFLGAVCCEIIEEADRESSEEGAGRDDWVNCFHGFSYISHLSVHEEARRRGVGRRLIEVALDGQHRGSCLFVDERNRNAVAFYEAVGFQKFEDQSRGSSRDKARSEAWLRDISECRTELLFVRDGKKLNRTHRLHGGGSM